MLSILSEYKRYVFGEILSQRETCQVLYIFHKLSFKVDVMSHYYFLSFDLDFYFKISICLLWWRCMGSSEDSFEGLTLSFYSVVSGDRTQVLRLGGNCRFSSWADLFSVGLIFKCWTQPPEISLLRLTHSLANTASG